MKRDPSILHFLRILPVSIFAEWTLFLPVVIIAILFITGMHWFLESNGRYFDLEYFGYGVYLTGFIALWFVSTMATHLGNQNSAKVLSVIPLEPWKKTLLVNLEHLLMALIWGALPFGLVVAIVHPVGFYWIWFFVFLLIGNSAFFISSVILKIAIPFLPDVFEELCLSDLAFVFGVFFFFVFVAPSMGGPISGLAIPIIPILILVLILSLIATFAVNFIRLQQKVSEFDKLQNEDEIQEFIPLNPDMIERKSNVRVPYKVFVHLSTRVFVNFLFIAAGLFTVHSIADYWMYELDDQVYLYLGVNSTLYSIIDNFIFYFFVPVGFFSMSCFYFVIYLYAMLIGCVILDCRFRPIGSNNIVIWSLINVIILSLGIRITFSGLALEWMIGLNATLSLIVFFSGGTVFAFAMVPGINRGRSAEISMDDLGYEGIVALLIAGLSMLFVIVTNSISIEEQPISLLMFGVMIVYNIWAMFWMWKRY